MSAHDRWTALAGVLGGAALALACIDGVLLWELQSGATMHDVLVVVKIGLIATPLLAAATALVRIRQRQAR